MASRSPTRSTWVRSPRAPARRSTSSPRPRPALICSSARRTATPSAGSRRRWSTPRERGLIDAGRRRGVAGACRRSAAVAGLGRPDAGPRGRRLRGAPRARARARGTLDDAGPGRCGRLPLRLPAEATILAVMPTPTDLTPADTSSVVAPGLAAALRARLGRVEELVVPIAPADAEIAAVRERARAADSMRRRRDDRSALGSPGQAALVDALAATGTPTIAVALRTPWDVATYPDAVHGCVHLLDPARLARRARRARCSARSRSPAGSRSRSMASVAACDHDRAMTLRDEILEQPAARAGSLPTQSASVDAIADSRSAAARSTTWSSPPAAPRTMPRSTRSTCSASGTGSRSGSRRRRSCRVYGAEPRLAADARPRHQPVGRVAGHRRGRGRGPAPGRPDRRADQRPVLRRSRSVADWTLDLGAGPERAIAATKTYTASLLAVAALSAGAHRRTRTALRADPALRDARTRSRRCSRLEPEMDRIARDQAARRPAARHRPRLRVRHRTRVGAQDQGARPRLRGPVLRGGLPARAGRAGRAWRAGHRDRPRTGPTAAGLIELLARLRDELGASSRSSRTCRTRWRSAAGPSRAPPGPPSGSRPIASIVAGQLHALPPDGRARPRPGRARATSTR